MSHRNKLIFLLVCLLVVAVAATATGVTVCVCARAMDFHREWFGKVTVFSYLAFVGAIATSYILWCLYEILAADEEDSGGDDGGGESVPADMPDANKRHLRAA